LYQQAHQYEDVAILKKDFLNELTLMNMRRESKEEALEEED